MRRDFSTYSERGGSPSDHRNRGGRDHTRGLRATGTQAVRRHKRLHGHGPGTPGWRSRLFKRCAAAIRAHENPVVVPSKVVDELTKQSLIDTSGLSEERVGPIKKAGNALVFLDAAVGAGLIRTDLGDVSNPYLDDLFSVEVFKRAAHRYEMCLLTNDTALRLRIRLLAAETDRRLVAGVLPPRTADRGG